MKKKLSQFELNDIYLFSKEFVNKRKVYIFKANGEISKNKSDIQAGDSIYVSEKLEKISIIESINNTLKFITNVLTPILLINNLSN